MKKQKLIVIVGPTASGKSELAVFLAHEIKKRAWGGFRGAEIVSADSRQVYKYLDVGTNKVHGKWKTFGGRTSDNNCRKSDLRMFIYKTIFHHCVDFVHPRKIFTAAEYKECAKKSIDGIIARGNMPILVGGTGFYIQVVADGLILPEVPPNKKLRAALGKRTTKQLFSMLQKLDPERTKHIDAKNHRRLMRAIEICRATQKRIPQLTAQKKFQILFIGTKKNDAELIQAIKKRSRTQVPGLLKETQLLLKLKIPKKRIRELGFEYSLTLSCIQTSGSPPSAILRKGDFRILAQKLAKENWRYTKRQMTWFKRDTQIHWTQTKKDALDLVRAFLI